MDLGWIHHSQPQFAFQASINDKPLGFPTHGKPKVLNPRRKLPLAMASVPAGTGYVIVLMRIILICRWQLLSDMAMALSLHQFEDSNKMDV